MGRVVVVAFGTSGSTQSSVALAIGLQARGHEVTVAGGANLQATVASRGIRFVPVRPDRERVEPDKPASSRERKTRTESVLKNLMGHME
jgi:rhamnosyltransferase subunit B